MVKLGLLAYFIFESLRHAASLYDRIVVTVSSLLIFRVTSLRQDPQAISESTYKILHPRFFFFTIKAALVALSNTSRTPSFVLAEHSK